MATVIETGKHSASKKGWKHNHQPAHGASKGKRQQVAKKKNSNNSALRYYLSLENAKKSEK